ILGVVLYKARGTKETTEEEEGKTEAAPQAEKKGKVSFDEAQQKAQKQKDLKVKTVVIEQEEPEKKPSFTPKKVGKGKGIESIPVKKRDYIESSILKILYKEKSVKSQSALIEKVLEASVKDKKTISEKNIKLLIEKMRKEKKIKFTQKEGWKIQI
ncbi:MAG: hypothetical protein ACOC4M_13155, partial [Promethearchaeia archaeon]